MGSLKLDIVGLVKGKITVVRQMEDAPLGRTQFMIRCECGTERPMLGKEITREKSKFSTCSCHKEHTKEFKDHPLYDVWKGMKARCLDPKHISFKNYGGRGVMICDEWLKSFLSFYLWATSNGWGIGMHLDKDSKGTGFLYSPATCVFITPLKNARMSRQTKLTEHIARLIKYGSDGPAALAKRYSVCKATIHHIRQGRIWKEV